MKVRFYVDVHELVAGVPEVMYLKQHPHQKLPGMRRYAIDVDFPHEELMLVDRVLPASTAEPNDA